MLSFLYGPTLTFVHDYWKTIDLTIHIFVSKVTSLLFNTLSRFVTASHHSGAGTKCWIFSPSKVHHVSLHQISLTYILPNSLVHNSLWRECSVRAGNFFSIVTNAQVTVCLFEWISGWDPVAQSLSKSGLKHQRVPRNMSELICFWASSSCCQYSVSKFEKYTLFK